ncbi:CFEM domain-containing protein [Aspergillus novoparasiticus]|uniref:CFEM domain-containing protein n=1 Tax=Aspergillus novoparasiticus TaxID=986946 RepID=A0A5N6F8J3_9EURO|nr:CFEM domain-containing protein [Aspergillus novoparasiticus]
MQLIHHIIILFASLAAAQNLPNIPPCAASCLVNALQGDGCQSLTDFACHCQKPELVPKVSPCVAQACPVAEQSSVSNVVVSACSSAGHPISVPNPGASTTPQSTTTTTATVTGTGTRASPTGSMTIPTVSSHASSSPRPSSSAASSSHVSSSPGASTHTGGAGGGAGGASSSGTASSSATPPLKTNGAAQVTGGLTGVAIAAVAAYYHL